jgi:DinB family protein
MTTPPERYADLAGLLSDHDPAMLRLVGQLDEALRPQAAPRELRATLERLLEARTPAPLAAPAVAPDAPGVLSRREALKAGAASMAWFLMLRHIGPEQADALARLAGDGPMTGTKLVGILQTERTRWNALLAQIGTARMEEPGVEGEWSAKELVAHLTWYERALVEGARQVLVGGAYVRPSEGPHALTMDERNARIAEESRARPVGDVLAEAEQVFGQLTTLIVACPQDLLNDPRRLGLPEDVVPWMMVANNSYGHFQQHEPAIRAWLERSSHNSKPR